MTCTQKVVELAPHLKTLEIYLHIDKCFDENSDMYLNYEVESCHNLFKDDCMKWNKLKCQNLNTFGRLPVMDISSSKREQL